MHRMRLRQLGLVVGKMPTGPLNSVTDVLGVRVGHSTIIHEEPVRVRTGITVIWPSDNSIWEAAVFAGCHSFNGCGEMTGMLWIAEQGLLASPIALTNTHRVGMVRDTLWQYAKAQGLSECSLLPVAAETYDGWLSASEEFQFSSQNIYDALNQASQDIVAEGSVGSGTGIICYEFKGGIGTSSRVIEYGGEIWTVGALVQSNFGKREDLKICGAPVGREIGTSQIPSAYIAQQEAGSIVVVLGTNAPLLPIQCQRLARRATVGIARIGGFGANASGDVYIAFSTANRITRKAIIQNVRMINPEAMTVLFEAASEAVEEAILNALTVADTMWGQKNRVAYALPLDAMIKVIDKYNPKALEKA